VVYDKLPHHDFTLPCWLDAELSDFFRFIMCEGLRLSSGVFQVTRT